MYADIFCGTQFTLYTEGSMSITCVCMRCKLCDGLLASEGCIIPGTKYFL